MQPYWTLTEVFLLHLLVSSMCNYTPARNPVHGWEKVQLRVKLSLLQIPSFQTLESLLLVGSVAQEAKASLLSHRHQRHIA